MWGDDFFLSLRVTPIPQLGPSCFIILNFLIGNMDALSMKITNNYNEYIYSKLIFEHLLS